MRLEVGAWLALAAAVAFGGVGVFAKFAFQEGWSSSSLLAIRFLIAALALAPFALRAAGTWEGWSRAVGMGAVGYVAMTALYFASFRELPAAAATFMVTLAPVLVAAYGWASRREMKGRWLLALTASVVGAVLMFAASWGGALSLAGLGLAGASAVAYAAIVVVGKRALRPLPPSRAALGICVGASATYALLALPAGDLFISRTPEAWAVVLGLSIVCTSLPLLLFYAGLARASPTQVAIAANFEPVSALVLAFVFLGETLPTMALAGGALILFGALLAALHDTSPRRRVSQHAMEKQPETPGDLVL